MKTFYNPEAWKHVADSMIDHDNVLNSVYVLE